MMAGNYLDNEFMRGMEDQQMVLPPMPMPLMDYQMFMTPQYERMFNQYLPNIMKPGIDG